MPKLPKITEEQWNRLSPDEQALLRKLNLAPRIKNSRKITEKSFVLGIYIHCHLCKKEHSRKFKMVPSLKENIFYYKGKPLHTDLVLEDQAEERWQAVCCHCKKELVVHYSKEELCVLLIQEKVKTAKRREMRL